MGDFYNVVHVGLPKTASTFMQKTIFPRLAGFAFVTSHRQTLDKTFAWVFRANGPFLPVMMARKEKRLNLELIFARESAKLERVTPQDGRALLFSSEGLVGCSHDPLLNADLNAKMIRMQVPNARVILCLRRQSDWCSSIYRQLVYREDRFRRFLRFDEVFQVGTASALVPVEKLSWDKLVEIYHEIFGVDNVCVLAYEELVENPSAFVERMLEFMGVDGPSTIDLSVRENVRPDVSLYDRGSWPRRVRALAGGLRDGRDRFKYELSGIVNDMRSGFTPVKQQFEEPSRSHGSMILQRLRSSNKRLSELTGYDFGAHGYY